MAILISFLNLLLYLAIILLIAYAIRWAITSFLGWSIDAMVYKWATIVVGLLCIIAIVIWIADVLGGGPGLPHFWVYR
jgi:hypothetical protein